VPGTNNVAVLDHSFGERAALVRANAAQSGESTIKVGYTDRHGAEKKFAHFAVRWKFGDSGDAQKVSHFCNITRKTRYNSSICGVID
jgi:hypothetical protein